MLSRDLLDKVCLPVMAESLDTFLDTQKQLESITPSMLELRVDYIKDISLDGLAKIFENKTKPSILTLRTDQEGGKFDRGIDEWIELTNFAIGLGFELVDLEFRNIRNIDLKKLNPKTKLIISYHNFETTPSYQKLRSIYKRMKSFKPNIYKFATKVKSNSDNQTLYRLLTNRSKHSKMAVMGMGQKAKIIRLLGPYLGSAICYLSANKDKASAPGQLSLQEFTEFTELFDSKLESK